MGGVEHGEANDVGLLVHDVVQSQEGEVLQRSRETVCMEEEHNSGV